MAEFAVNLGIEKLVSLLNQEVKQLRGIHREIRDIKDELESIRAFLKDADARAEEEDVSGGVKAWVKQVREVAYQIEDAIDEYTLHVAQNHDQYGFKGVLNRIVSSVQSLKQRHGMASDIQCFKASVREIKERSERYKFSSFEQGASSNNASSATSYDLRVGSLFVKETEFVGFESLKEELISQLADKGFQRIVISVVGMGGAGKTTLAKNVYDSQRVIPRFDCHAWVTVSQSYKKEELLRTIMKQFHEARKEPLPNTFETMDYTTLIAKLNEYLEQRRYLVVFDDTWEICFWEDVEHALLDNKKGSRIIITTRNKDVADFCKKSSFVHVHQMKPLPEEKAWKLFCRKAFNGHCPENLKELSIDIVGRCGGLPLAIVAIGGLLATKEKIISEWQKLQDSISSALLTNRHLDKITRILSLSYSDLPWYLKSCFLYFGTFPEDYSIRCKRLIRLWIAEGFIKAKQGMTLEEVADECLVELVHRSLVQVDKLGRKGQIKSCRVHDLIHEVIVSKSEELSSCQVSTNDSNFEGIARHLSICNSVKNISRSSTNSQTRSVMILEADDLPKQLICTIFAKFKLLKVLDFEGATFDYIPKELENLLLLSYLSLRDTKVKILPKSISKLRNLETLDLRDSKVDEVPVEISRFHKLRHLLCYRRLKIQGNIGKLEFLQTLYNVKVDPGKWLISDLGRLKQLRKLGIRNLRSQDGRALCSALENLIELRSLTVSSVSEEELLELESMSSPPLGLQSLGLKGPLSERLPGWILKLKSLVKLRLFGSRLMEDPLMVVQQALPNLMCLDLSDVYKGEQLRIGGGFKKLKALALGNSDRLKSLIIDEGALPLLEVLGLWDIPQLKEVAPTIQHLKNLKTLENTDMPKEFVQRMLPQAGGQDHWIVEHIPDVKFFFSKGGRYLHYKLGDPKLVEYLRH